MKCPICKEKVLKVYIKGEMVLVEMYHTPLFTWFKHTCEKNKHSLKEA